MLIITKHTFNSQINSEKNINCCLHHLDISDGRDCTLTLSLYQLYVMVFGLPSAWHANFTLVPSMDVWLFGGTVM